MAAITGIMTTDSKSNTSDSEKVPRDHHDIERVSAASDASVADRATFSEALTAAPRQKAGEAHDIDMRIARDGTWFYLGTPINRRPLVKLFSTILHREADGEYYLITPVEKARITVEDAPFTAVEMQVTGTGKNQELTFRTNVDDNVTVDASHPLRVAIDDETGEPSPYIMVREGLEALVGRAVFYDLVELGVENDNRNAGLIGVWSGGAWFELGRTDDAGQVEGH